MSSRKPFRRFRALTAFLVAGAFVLVTPAPAQAQVDLDVRGGLYTDVEEAFIGGGVLMPVTGNWFFNPNVEYVFIDPGSLWTINGDFHYDFAQRGNWSIWAGGGPAVVFRDFDDASRRGQRARRDDETDFGANLLVGAGWTRGGIRPFIQGKVLISDETEAVIAVGLRF